MIRPTTQELIDRLEELSDAVTRGREGMSEFTMHIPARPTKDADLVLSAAAVKIKALREALRTCRAMSCSDDAEWPMVAEVVDKVLKKDEAESD